ncbi:hypothetical protein TNCV_4193011 [Trichonephila clavipes]|nr:hypothetical protein TNCV_4193011 [Trichonephila clavipes]
MVAKVTKLTTNYVVKNDANLALPQIFRQVLIQSPLQQDFGSVAKRAVTKDLRLLPVKDRQVPINQFHLAA